MDKHQIIETAFEIIKDSTEWGTECKDNKGYGYWIGGVITVVEELLMKIDEKNNSTDV